MFVAALCIGAGGAAQAADDTGSVSGSINLGVRGVDDQDKRSAKFWEFRDMKDGALSNISLSAEKNNYYFDLTSNNIGHDDQYFKLSGGNYGNFKYSLWYNETPHNYTFGAKSFYSGIGTSLLDYGYVNSAVVGGAYTPTVPTNASLWNDFDYAIKRKDWGGNAELSFNMPVYFKVEVTRNEMKGIKANGAPSGVYATRTGATSPFGNLVELPEPVDYVTNNLYLETGYKGQNFTGSLDGTLSDFKNSNDYLTWRNPYVTNATLYETSSLAPDNTYWKVGGQFKLNLPLNSVLSARGSYAKLENSFGILNTIWQSTNTPVYTQTTLGLSNGRFEGDIAYKSASVALSSNPVKSLDIKAYYNFLEKDNDSTQITFTGTSGTPTTNQLFGYTKHNAGLDFGYRLPGKNKVDTGYEFQNINRPVEREDATNTTDHKMYVQLKNNSLDMLTAKIRYQYLIRSADFENDNATDVINRYIRRFDATDKTQHAIKAGFDLEPIEHLGIGLEYAYKLDDYDETIIGLTKAQRHEFYVDVAYEIPQTVKLSAYFDYEKTKNQSASRNFTTNANAIPTLTPSATAYNWNATTKDDNWGYGVGAEVPVLKDKFTVVASWSHERTNGTNDLKSQNNYGSPISFGTYDNTETKAINLKTIYQFTKNVDITAGYGYERYTYSDPGYDGYTYVMNNTTSPTSYLTGAYADSNYEAHLGYISMGYKF